MMPIRADLDTNVLPSRLSNLKDNSCEIKPIWSPNGGLSTDKCG